MPSANRIADGIKLMTVAMTLGVAAMSMGVSPKLDAQSFYDDRAEGWWWYNEPVIEEPEEEEPEEEKVPQIIVMQPPEKPPKPEEAEPRGPAPLSAAWFRESLQTYMDKAIDDPSPENVEAYFLLQRVMMDKAQEFSEASQRVVIGDPILDEINRRSLDPSSSRAQETLSAERRDEMLAKVLESAGLAFFFSEDCDLCDRQASHLSFLAQRTSLEVMAVSLDGSSLAGGIFADATVIDNGQAEFLGVDSGPALFLVAPPDQWIPIARGVVTQEDAISRILMAATDAGIITEQEFNRTRAVNATQSLAGVLSGEKDLPEDTESLIKLLRAMENQ